MPLRDPILPALLTALLLAGCGGKPSGDDELLVFAAASLRDVAVDLGAAFEERNPAVAVSFNFAGSNVLAQQIAAAPRADLFLSADLRWLDFLEERGRLVPGSRRAFLGNRLALVARRDSPVAIDDPRRLADADYRHLAVADPEAVPAGRYARAALGSIPLEDVEGGEGGDLWSAVAGRVAPALDVRAALALVESDPEIVGIVYRTDAATSEKVKVLHLFPEGAGGPIRYGAALVEGDRPGDVAERFLAFLTTPAACAVAERHGFTVPGA
jgi:molybdate transport system substrate-binding protein